MRTSRLEAFSDGVFAVAITLLFFNLKVPDLSNGNLGHALANQWPSYLAFVISFFTIGVCWVNHNSIFDRVSVADRALLFTNLGLLLGIVCIPFTTSLAATWYNQKSNAKLAIAIYCANWVLVSLFFMLILGHLYTHEHLAERSKGVTIKSLLSKGYIGLTAYIVATLMALISPVVAYLICAFLIVFFVFGVHQEELVIKEVQEEHNL